MSPEKADSHGKVGKAGHPTIGVPTIGRGIGWEPGAYARPDTSHLGFPKFDGRREEYANYQHAVISLKS